jgi:membrane-bound serine protease (ClpP class)
MNRWLLALLSIFFTAAALAAPPINAKSSVVILDAQGGILPGTSGYLKRGIEAAKEANASLVILQLNTPGGMLNTSQEMIQTIFESPIPIVVYVTPTGGIAASAGVFITMAAHIAAMAPGCGTPGDRRRKGYRRGHARQGREHDDCHGQGDL